jgi:eukaryotic-like serine/threonine-protein kinase
MLFGPYELENKIASGGMGEVYVATKRGLEGFEKRVCIKRILGSLASEREYVEMFLAEARLAGRLSHPNIVQVFDAGVIDGSYYVAMEYVEGRSLQQMLDRGSEQNRPISVGLAIELVCLLCSALSYAHNLRDERGRPLGIVHRDVNPRNILISKRGEVKLIDFGIAKSALSRRQTNAGVLKGSFDYMSPEQTRAEETDKRSDVFSMGIVLHELLTNKHPFLRANPVLTMEAIQKVQAPPLGELRRELAVLDPVLAKALEKDPERRLRDASELSAELAALQNASRVPRPALSLGTFLASLFPTERTERTEPSTRLHTAVLSRPTEPASTPRPAERTMPAQPSQPASAVFAPISSEHHTMTMDPSLPIIYMKRNSVPLNSVAKMQWHLAQLERQLSGVDCSRLIFYVDAREAPLTSDPDVERVLREGAQKINNRFYKSVIICRTPEGKKQNQQRFQEIGNVVQFFNEDVAKEYVLAHLPPA